MPRLELIGEAREHAGCINSAEFDSSGIYCLTAGNDRSVRLWNPVRQLHIKRFFGPHNYHVNDVCLSGDSTRFVSAGAEHSAFYWDTVEGKVIRKFNHGGSVACCNYVADQSLVCTGSDDRSVRFWDHRSRGAVSTLSDAKDGISSVSERDCVVVASSIDGAVRSYDLRKGLLKTDYFPKPVVNVSVSTVIDDCYVASVLDDSVALVEGGDVLGTYRGHTCDSYRVRCTLDPCEEFVLCGSSDGTLFCWPLADPSAPTTVPGAHSGPLTALAFSNPSLLKDGRLVRDLEKDVRDALRQQGSLMALKHQHVLERVAADAVANRESHLEVPDIVLRPVYPVAAATRANLPAAAGRSRRSSHTPRSPSSRGTRCRSCTATSPSPAPPATHGPNPAPAYHVVLPLDGGGDGVPVARRDEEPPREQRVAEEGVVREVELDLKRVLRLLALDRAAPDVAQVPEQVVVEAGHAAPRRSAAEQRVQPEPRPRAGAVLGVALLRGLADVRQVPQTHLHEAPLQLRQPGPLGLLGRGRGHPLTSGEHESAVALRVHVHRVYPVHHVRLHPPHLGAGFHVDDERLRARLAVQRRHHHVGAVRAYPPPPAEGAHVVVVIVVDLDLDHVVRVRRPLAHEAAGVEGPHVRGLPDHHGPAERPVEDDVPHAQRVPVAPDGGDHGVVRRVPEPDVLVHPRGHEQLIVREAYGRHCVFVCPHFLHGLARRGVPAPLRRPSQHVLRHRVRLRHVAHVPDPDHSVPSPRVQEELVRRRGHDCEHAAIVRVVYGNQMLVHLRQPVSDVVHGVQRDSASGIRDERDSSICAECEVQRVLLVAYLSASRSTSVSAPPDSMHIALCSSWAGENRTRVITPVLPPATLNTGIILSFYAGVHRRAGRLRPLPPQRPERLDVVC
ncbi:WD40 repeat-like protein [Babesia caballi]|uniref:WD40 repeat-like protein n=1 Tax=Babesia caballi TaxID=5871 RepID=A0AAV4LW43_BABCB|nr:WD40 repeat-like protein [Babesia caballi]